MCLMLDQFLWGLSSRVCDISCSIQSHFVVLCKHGMKQGIRLVETCSGDAMNQSGSLIHLPNDRLATKIAVSDRAVTN